MKLKRKVEKSDIVSIVTLVIITVLLIIAGIRYASFFDISEAGIEQTAENLKSVILSFGSAAVLIFTMMHALQVVIAAIPAALVQFVGGIIYGTFWGVIITEIGVFIGTAIAFYISRFLGKRVVSLFVSGRELEKIGSMVNSETSSMVLLILFIVPGFPKDILAYLLGLTDAKSARFFIISAIGRLPGIVVSTYLGANILEVSHTLIILICVVLVIAFLLIYILRNKIIAFVNKKKTK